MRIEIWIYRSSGADIDVYAIWGGRRITRLAWPPDGRLLQKVIAGAAAKEQYRRPSDRHRGRTSVLSPYPATALAYGRHLLRHGTQPWRKSAPPMAPPRRSSPGSVILDQHRQCALKTIPQGRVRRSRCGLRISQRNPGAACRREHQPGGNVDDHDRTTTPKGYGPGCLMPASTDASTPASVGVDGDRHRFLLLYLQQTGRRSFRWKRLMQADGRPWTPTTRQDLAQSAITGLIRNASHHANRRVVSADSAGIVILGVDCQVSGKRREDSQNRRIRQQRRKLDRTPDSPYLPPRCGPVAKRDRRHSRHERPFR